MSIDTKALRKEAEDAQRTLGNERKFRPGEVIALCDELDAARSALVPTGYKLVPEEPTEEMMRAAMGWREFDCPEGYESLRSFYGTYRAMLAAAPPAPASQERGEVPEPVAFLGPDGLPSPPLRFPQPWRDDPERYGLISLYEHPPLTTTPFPSRREALEEAVAAIEAERARWTATAPFGQGRASGFSKAIEAVRALIPSEGK